METLIAVGVLLALFIFGWFWNVLTDSAEDKALDLADRAIYGRERQATTDLGEAALRIRTSVNSADLWKEISFRLPLPYGKPKFQESLYIAGELESTQEGNYGLRINWDECIQSAIVVIRESDKQTVCEHAMLQWAESGMAMRKAVSHFNALRENLVALVQGMDPQARVTLVDEHDRETPFTASKSLN
ncbi:hypothetical protein [Hoyosella altamirensis]|uniref:Uncharacterized protein n=1 Tax=Hoyosella altamirensis TaxID=616997 RepID=A0A839RJL7_9ACTN|nr:hypothetical protein [Hoyosella altamirensis]MBB3036597.1 hypothetical protein [Hoyosella altamirensis]